MPGFQPGHDAHLAILEEVACLYLMTDSDHRRYYTEQDTCGEGGCFLNIFNHQVK